MVKKGELFPMSSVKSYRDLIVWQKSINLTEKIYVFTRQFPKEEIYGVVSQMRRAATSIPANIAEGQARNSRKEFIQFLGIAKGSLAELETFIILSERLNYIPESRSKELLTACEEISKLLNGLLRSLSTCR
ncbi:MAG: four helix bundle protein [Candidatus Omnitrophota bacterium]